MLNSRNLQRVPWVTMSDVLEPPQGGGVAGSGHRHVKMTVAMESDRTERPSV